MNDIKQKDLENVTGGYTDEDRPPIDDKKERRSSGEHPCFRGRMVINQHIAEPRCALQKTSCRDYDRCYNSKKEKH